MRAYSNYMINAMIVCVIIQMFNACTLFGQSDNNLMRVFMTSYVSEDKESCDSIIAYHSISSLINSNDIVDCLSSYFDINPNVVFEDLDNYINLYEGILLLAGYTYNEYDDLVTKTVYFNRYGYIIPYDIAILQLTNNLDRVKVLRDDIYQRVFDYDIED